MTALIDADSIVYIIAYNFREEPEFADSSVKLCCDDFIRSILASTQADKYVGVFSSSTNFRHTVYLYQPYKGDRPAKADWLLKWEPVIKGHLTEKWGFYTSPDLEADDVVVALSTMLEDAIICSPDKDLRQAACLHFDYKKQEKGVETVTPEQALKNLWMQVLTGDSTDCIAGVPGLGEVKVKKLFDDAEKIEVLNEISMSRLVQAQYNKYFGPYYGPQIFKQTLSTVMMVQPGHNLWEFYKTQIRNLIDTHVNTTPEYDESSDEAVLNELGWDLPS